MTIKELIEQLQEQDPNKNIKVFDDINIDAYPVEGIEDYFDNDIVINFNRR